MDPHRPSVGRGRPYPLAMSDRPDFAAHRKHMGITDRFAGPGCCLAAEGIVYWQKADVRTKIEVFGENGGPGIVGPAVNGWVRTIEIRGNPKADSPKYVYVVENVDRCPCCGSDISASPKPSKAPGRAPKRAA